MCNLRPELTSDAHEIDLLCSRPKATGMSTVVLAFAATMARSIRLGDGCYLAVVHCRRRESSV
jgi:hypothetical protein